MNTIDIQLNLSSSKKKIKEEYDSEEEKELENLVFGDPNNVFKKLETSESDSEIHENERIPRKEDSSNDEDSDEKENEEKEESKTEVDSLKRKPAWLDEDDENYSIKQALIEQSRRLPNGRPEKSYNELLEKKFINIVGTPKWAELKEKVEKIADSEDESDEDILKHSGHIALQKSTNLKEDILDIKILPFLNRETRSEGSFICAVQFHPTSMVAFVAGSSGVLSLFKVDGKENTKLTSLAFKKFSICGGSFIKNGDEIVVSNYAQHHFFTYNLISGKTNKILLPHGITNMKVFRVSPDQKLLVIKGRFGEIHVLDSTTFELKFTLQMNHQCNTFDFTPDNKYLISHGESEEMYVWNLKTRKCINKPRDDGCFSCSSVAISSSGQFLATGSSHGVVNIYNLNDVLTKKIPIPLKRVMNLVTAITALKFNPQSEILAMASNEKKNAFKLVHLPSFRVFQNFPRSDTILDKPFCIEFSPGSGYMSISNDKGRAKLFKLRHYGNY